MARNIVLKTYKGGNVTPQNDAIVYQTAIPGAGIFKGCEVSYARGNVLHISQGFGMICGRFFEVYETEVDVRLADTGTTLDGRLYIHLDLSNTDEPIQILTETASELSTLDADTNINYNDSSYDLELATFRVSSTELSNLTQVFGLLSAGGGSGGGGGNTLARSTAYNVGDTATTASASGWVTLWCTQAGVTAASEPTGYKSITAVGDKVLDGTVIFTARNIIGELDEVIAALEDMDAEVEQLSQRLEDAMSSSGNLVTKIISLTEYKALESYNENCIYLCYEDANTQKITHIYLGENTIFFEGVSVTYQIDTEEAETTHLDDGIDALASAPTAVKEGYEFVGWRKDTEANSKVLTSCVIAEEGDLTLYAVFKKGIEIGMFPNGGTLIEGSTESTLSATCYYNNGNSLSSEVTIPVSPYERDEMSFCGWSCDGVLYKPGEKASFTDDNFIVPEWVTTVYDFPYTGSYVPFTIPADGIYEFEVWGASGANATKNDVIGKGGLGGHAKGYRKMTKGDLLYIYNGGTPSTYSYAGANGGGSGYTYSSNGAGAAGGGATSIMTRSGTISSSSTSTQSSNYKNREEDILIIAGGGGGGGVTSAGVANDGGDGGGDRGGDGSDGALGGRQISTGSNEYTNFGCAPSYSGSSTTYSGGGGGYFAGQYDTYGQSAAGGSGYVGGVAAYCLCTVLSGNRQLWI